MAGRAKKNGKLNAIIVAILVVLAVGSFAAVRVFSSFGDVSTARVVVKDSAGDTHKFSLSEDAVETITTDAGTNVIEIADGRVRVREADCPNQDCVHQSWIENAEQQIVCLPHKLTVDIVDEEAEPEYDVVGR